MNKLLFLVFFVGMFILKTYPQDGERAANLSFKNGNFNVALDGYLKLHKKDTNNFFINLRVGLCYLEANKEASQAIPFFERALGIKPNDPDALLGMARALMHSHRFEESEALFMQFKRLKARSPLNNLADLYIQNIKNAQELIQIPLNVSFTNLGDEINSSLDETAPFVSSDEQYLFFTTNRKYDREFGVFIKDVFLSERGRNVWKKSKGVSGLSTMEDESVVGIGEDFLLCQLLKYEIFDDIAIVPRSNGKLGAIINPGIPVNGKESENGAWLSSNQDTLIFASDRLGGKGGFDLYICVKLPDGRWANPINLGESINSMYDEDYPQLIDGEKLYFASNRPESMGGFDIFVSNFDRTGNQYSEPHNIGYPINSTYNNFTICFGQGNRYAYISDIRPEGKGGYDIYKVVFNNVEPPVNIYKYEIFTGVPENAAKYNMDTIGTLNIQLVDFFNGELVGKFEPDAAGDFMLALSPGKYKLFIASQKIEPYQEIILVPDEPLMPEKKKLFLKFIVINNE